MSRDEPGLSSQPLQRLRGAVRLRVDRSGDRSVVQHRYEAGSGRVRFPAAATGEPPEAVIINLGGGMTDGDRFDVDLVLSDSAELVATTQAAEKAYRSRGTFAVMATTARLGRGAELHWLPQETILYERSRLRRELTVDLDADARFLGTETIILGRVASGESLHDAALVDRCILRRNGALVWHDSLRLVGDLAELGRTTSILDNAAAISTLIYAATDAESLVERARELLPSDGIRAGISCRGGVLVARFLAPNGGSLRTALATFLLAFRSALKGKEVRLPRVWSC